jgi:hypothetical protein
MIVLESLKALDGYDMITIGHDTPVSRSAIDSTSFRRALDDRRGASAIPAQRGALVRRRAPAHQRRTHSAGGSAAGRAGGRGALLHSLGWARRQGALSWELRTSTSLARLQCDQGRIVQARSLLQSVYDRFSEGFETADLMTAKAHLVSMQ